MNCVEFLIKILRYTVAKVEAMEELPVQDDDRFKQ
jgi:hypothetical protein